ncbi:hypothetical protein JCM12296A_45320 [Desulfosarcina cetonica]
MHSAAAAQKHKTLEILMFIFPFRMKKMTISHPCAAVDGATRGAGLSQLDMALTFGIIPAGMG